MDVSFIIINYNTTELTVQCINSITNYTKKNSFEIIVVDNNSGDRSIESLQATHPDCKLIFNNENVGFGRANNLGVKYARGKYIFLLNSDAYLLNDCVSIFWKYMEDPNNFKTVCCGGELLKENGDKNISFGNFPTLTEAILRMGFCFLIYKYYKRNISSGVVNYSDNIKEVDYVTGADMFIRKADFEKIGGFDPMFFLYYEETELSFRFKMAGYRSILIPQARIVHLEGASQTTSQKFNSFKVNVFTFSRVLYHKKCQTATYAFLVQVVYFFRYLIQGLLTFNLKHLRTASVNLKYAFQTHLSN